jgi:hypothetical protein
MAQGLTLPVQAAKGRAVLDQGDDELRKVIMIALSDCDSANPFQDLGLDPSDVFAINDEVTQAEIRQRIAVAFKRFEAEGLARLLPGYPKFGVNSVAQELISELKYQNLETTLTEDLSLAWTGSGAPRIVGE